MNLLAFCQDSKDYHKLLNVNNLQNAEDGLAIHASLLAGIVKWEHHI